MLIILPKHTTAINLTVSMKTVREYVSNDLIDMNVTEFLDHCYVTNCLSPTGMKAMYQEMCYDASQLARCVGEPESPANLQEYYGFDGDNEYEAEYNEFLEMQVADGLLADGGVAVSGGTH